MECERIRNEKRKSTWMHAIQSLKVYKILTKPFPSVAIAIYFSERKTLLPSRNGMDSRWIANLSFLIEKKSRSPGAHTMKPIEKSKSYEYIANMHSSNVQLWPQDWDCTHTIQFRSIGNFNLPISIFELLVSINSSVWNRNRKKRKIIGSTSASNLLQRSP